MKPGLLFSRFVVIAVCVPFVLVVITWLLGLQASEGRKRILKKALFLQDFEFCLGDFPSRYLLTAPGHRSAFWALHTSCTHIDLSKSDTYKADGRAWASPLPEDILSPAGSYHPHRLSCSQSPRHLECCRELPGERSASALRGLFLFTGPAV